MSDDTRKLIPIGAVGLIVLIGIVAWRLEPTALAILLGVFFGGVFALGAVMIVLLSRPQQQPQRETVREVRYLPEPQPFPYQPPVIVLAAPRERTNNVVSVDHPTTLARR